MTGRSPLCQVGFVGKLPSHGDFVGRRLDQAFRTALDDWLQQSITVSRRQLGPAWLPAYLIAPVWRFVLGPGLCGAAAWGVMMPSVDRVGRYFPLTVAAQLPGCPSPALLFGTARDWFDRAEALVLRALDDDFDLDAFDRDLVDMGVPSHACAGAARGARLEVKGADPSAAQAGFLDRVLMGDDSPFSLWWTLGSEAVSASVLLSPGLPAPAGFAAFLDGQWDRWGWRHHGQGKATLEGLPLLMPMDAADGDRAAGSTA